MKVKLFLSGLGSDEDIDQMFSNFDENYPEFETIEDDYHQFEKNGMVEFQTIITGNWNGEINDLIRLTHHAEDFYENTDIEYFHVEVCIDKWYGGFDHETIEKGER